MAQGLAEAATAAADRSAVHIALSTTAWLETWLHRQVQARLSFASTGSSTHLPPGCDLPSFLTAVCPPGFPA